MRSMGILIVAVALVLGCAGHLDEPEVALNEKELDGLLRALERDSEDLRVARQFERFRLPREVAPGVTSRWRPLSDSGMPSSRSD